MMARLRRITVTGIVLAGAAALLPAQGVNVLPPLPKPLVLPPGNDEVLPLAKSSSYLGDAIRIVDCPNPADEPFGTCGNVLFGGLAMYNTHLTGFVHIHFETPVNNIAHFEVTHPDDMVGDDVFMSAPQFFEFGIGQNRILDDFNTYSTGDLNLVTGEVTNLNYSVFASNSFYFYLENANPQLKPPPFSFPGIYGSAYASFAQRADGLLDFTFYGSTFLPLGSDVKGDPVRVPLPLCGPFYNCANIQSIGLSLHPHLAESTIVTKDPLCGAACPVFPTNTQTEFTLNSAASVIGNDFSRLVIPQLGAGGTGWSQVQGRVQIQFGKQNGNYIPVALTALPPAGLLVPPPAFPAAGLSAGWLGHDEFLKFPRQTYDVTGTATADDPFDYAIGELDVTTGKLVGGLLWRQFWSQSLLTSLLNVNQGAVAQQSFWLRGPADFTTGTNGEILFRFSGKTYLDLNQVLFPAPDNSTSGVSYTTPAGSVVAPFNNIQAAMTQDTPVQVLTGGQSNIVSSHSDTFTYSYTMPCAPAGKSASFRYTNNNATSGGTFTLQSLVDVTCTNSRASTATSGNYDSVSFSGFGSWSKDSNLHVATVQVVNAPGSPTYVSIQIDGGLVSNVNLKPSTIPAP